MWLGLVITTAREQAVTPGERSLGVASLFILWVMPLLLFAASGLCVLLVSIGLFLYRRYSKRTASPQAWQIPSFYINPFAEDANGCWRNIAWLQQRPLNNQSFADSLRVNTFVTLSVKLGPGDTTLGAAGSSSWLLRNLVGVWMSRSFLVGLCVLIFTVGLILVACGGGGNTASQTAFLNVSISDPPTCSAPSGPYSNVFVTVTDVKIHTSANAGSNDSGWVDLTQNLKNINKQVDLL
jgi:hypothetical protein